MTKSVYMSYPQLFKLRKLFRSVKDLVEDNSGFVFANDGMVSVKQGCEEPFIFENIGKGNNWIALRLVATQIGENIVQTVPGVSIELSTGNGYQSVLTVDEFLTIYTIIEDLDLTTIQCMTSLAFLDTPSGQMQNNMDYGMSYPSQQQYNLTPAAPYNGSKMTTPYIDPQPQYQQYNSYNSSYQQGANNGYVNRGQYQRKPAQQPYQQRQAAPYQQPVQPQNQPVTDSTPYISARPAQTTTSYQNEIPPRSEKKMTFANIDDTPVSDFMIDDDALVDSIFKNISED
jgi:hypothetical protein